MTEAKSTPLFDLAGKRVVAGHTGMVGAALVRRLSSESYTLLTVDRTALEFHVRHPSRPAGQAEAWHSLTSKH
jgi:GDP-L-fucose synthase